MATGPASAPSRPATPLARSRNRRRLRLCSIPISSQSLPHRSRSTHLGGPCLPPSIRLLPSANHLGLTPGRIVRNTEITAARKLAGPVAERAPAAEQGLAEREVRARAERAALEPAERGLAE